MDLLAAARQVRLLAMDIDGTLTDGSIWIGPQGECAKRFSVRDGFGIKLLQKAGIELAIITGRRSEIVARRAEELGIRHVFQDVPDKLVVLKELGARLGIGLQEMAFIGDDWPDLAATASVLILIGLGMVSYYFAKQAEQNHGAPAVEGRPDPDFFVEQMTLMRADANGNPSVRVEADHMLHYPLDQRMAFTRPRIISLDETQPLTTITSRKGSAPDSGDYADLQEDVQVLRAATADAPPMQLTTETARVDMVHNLISTAAPVQMQAGDNRLEGVGMEIRDQDHQLELKSRVRGHFPATARGDDTKTR